MNDLFTLLFYNYLDVLITLYYTQYPFHITPSQDITNHRHTMISEIDNKSTTTVTTEKPVLMICTTKQDNNKNLKQFNKIRHHTFSSTYNDYCHHQHPQSAYPDVPQLLFSPTSSVSSFGSSFNWSPDENSSSKRSKVEDMIHLFEHGHRYMDQHRRYSVDSHLNCYKKAYIHERKYEYQPIVGEWKRRINGDFPNVHLSESKSTPVQQSRRKITPIMETSRSNRA